MKRPFCRPGLLWEYTITVSCHCLMPSPFMQDIQGGAPGERPTSDEGKRLARDRHRMREDAWRGSRAKVLPTGGSPGGNRGDSDWRLTRRKQGKSD